jgi:hypothetical protein
MDIELQADPSLPAAELRRFVEHRVEYALGGLHDRVAGVRIHVGPALDSRDGGQRLYRARVCLSGRTAAVFTDSAANFYMAIHRAVDRAAGMATSGLFRSRPETVDGTYPVMQRIALDTPGRAA